MSEHSQLFARVRTAYDEFKNKVDTETHDQLLKKLEAVHYAAVAALAGEHVDIAGHEFAHALSALNKVPANSVKLPDHDLPAIVRSDGALLGTGKWELNSAVFNSFLISAPTDTLE